MVFKSQIKKTKRVQYQHKGQSLIRNRTKTAQWIVLSPPSPPTGEAIFWVGVSGTRQNTKSLRLTDTLTKR